MARKQTIVLSILVLGIMMGALDSTIVILAFPTIAEGLHSEIPTSIWIILIYLLILAVMTTPLGRVGDIYGRSRMFNIALCLNHARICLTILQAYVNEMHSSHTLR